MGATFPRRAASPTTAARQEPQERARADSCQQKKRVSRVQTRARPQARTGASGAAARRADRELRSRIPPARMQRTECGIVSPKPAVKARAVDDTHLPPRSPQALRARRARPEHLRTAARSPRLLRVRTARRARLRPESPEDLAATSAAALGAGHAGALAPESAGARRRPRDGSRCQTATACPRHRVHRWRGCAGWQRLGENGGRWRSTSGMFRAALPRPRRYPRS